MRELIQREHYDVMLEPGKQLCPDTEASTKHFAAVYQDYEERKQRYEEQTQAYELFWYRARSEHED
jgi:hypothetical protein